MKRVFLHITLASLAALAVYVISMMLLRSIIGSIEEIFWRYFISSFFMTVLYGISLFYFAKIRGRSEEQQILKDYETRPYDSIVKDFCLILRREKVYICFLFLSSALCFFLHILDGYLFEAKTTPGPLGHIAFIYSPIITMASYISYKPVGYLVSPACCAIVYLIAVCIYRRHCYNYWLKK